jgi:hypothetical protein
MMYKRFKDRTIMRFNILVILMVLFAQGLKAQYMTDNKYIFVHDKKWYTAYIEYGDKPTCIESYIREKYITMGDIKKYTITNEIMNPTSVKCYVFETVERGNDSNNTFYSRGKHKRCILFYSI